MRQGWLRPRGGVMQLPWWWPGPFLLQTRSLAWGEQQSISKVSQQGGCRDQRGAPELRVRPLGPQPCPAVGGTMASCWRKLEVLPPAPLTCKDLGKCFHLSSLSVLTWTARLGGPSGSEPSRGHLGIRPNGVPGRSSVQVPDQSCPGLPQGPG